MAKIQMACGNQGQPLGLLRNLRKKRLIRVRKMGMEKGCVEIWATEDLIQENRGEISWDLEM